MIRQDTSSSRLKSITEHKAPVSKSKNRIPIPHLLQPGKLSAFRLASIEGSINQPKVNPQASFLKLRRPNNFMNPLISRRNFTLNDCLTRQRRKNSHDMLTSRYFGPKGVLGSELSPMNLEDQIVFLKHEVLDYFIGNR